MRLTLACPRWYATFMSWFKNAEAIRDFLDGRKVLRFKSNHPPLTNKRKEAPRVAEADDLFCHRHFLLLHDPSFADVGSLFQSCHIIGDDPQGFFGHQTPTRWQIDAGFQVPARRLQIAQQTFAQSTHAPQ
jgi:hypothetical protein